MKYTIQYEHLKDDLVTNDSSRWCFKKVRDYANDYMLELSDDDFKRFFKLISREVDISWIMHKMSAYKISLVDALITYLTY